MLTMCAINGAFSRSTGLFTTAAKSPRSFVRQRAAVVEQRFTYAPQTSNIASQDFWRQRAKWLRSSQGVAVVKA